ncbi:hypothetical protein PG991_001838 [Apiospora marii]|uniref:Uncharacterized protein n=1 Tax=Apiospora marii TaxID=335849 RepID=A0ABR1SQ03_9PEZI
MVNRRQIIQGLPQVNMVDPVDHTPLAAGNGVNGPHLLLLPRNDAEVLRVHIVGAGGGGHGAHFAVLAVLVVGILDARKVVVVLDGAAGVELRRGDGIVGRVAGHGDVAAPEEGGDGAPVLVAAVAFLPVEVGPGLGEILGLGQGDEGGGEDGGGTHGD